MIESTSSQTGMHKALESRLSSPEEAQKAAVVENASKVGSKQHQRTMSFLTQKLGSVVENDQGARVAAGAEAALEESKKDAKRSQAEKIAVQTKPLNSASPVIDGEPPSVADGKPPFVDKPTLLPMEPPVPPAPPSLPPGFSLSSIGAKELQDHNRAMTEIMLKMSNLLSDSALDQVEANREYQAKSSQSNLKQIQTSEAEHIKEQEKADQAQKAASCIFQVVAAIVSVAMLIFSVVTANPVMIAVSILALGITIADTALAALGQTTVSEFIMKPIMEEIIQPMAEFFGGIITDILLSLGASEDAAKMAGMVLGFVAAISVIILMVVAAKNSSILQSAMSRMGGALGNMISKMTPTALKQMTLRMGASFGKMISAFGTKMNIGGSSVASRNMFAQSVAAGEDVGTAMVKASNAAAQAVAEGMKTVVVNTNIALQGASLSGGIAGGSAAVAGSVYRYNADMLRADLTTLFGDITSNSKMMVETQEFFTKMMEASTELMKKAMDSQAASNEAAKFVLGNIGKNV